MTEYIIQKGRIPSNIDLDELMKSLQGNSTRKQYIRDGIVYFLSLLVIDNYYSLQSNNGYRMINDKVLSDIVGKGEKESRTSIIKNVLLENGVIEKRTHRKGHYSTGFRLSPKYNTGLFIEIELSERIKKKLLQHQLNKVKSNKIDDTHLINQFSKHDINVDKNGAEMFLKKLGVEVLELIEIKGKKKNESRESLFNYIGKGMNIMKDISDKNFKFSSSESNNRFHSNLTSFPKIFRPFFKINGEDIGEVDLNCSQSFILSTILRESFFENENEGYNLKTIYPELKNDMNNLRHVVPSNQSNNRNYLMGVYLNDFNYKSIKSFIDFDFTNDFYKSILDEGKILHPDFIKSNKIFNQGRDFVKKHIMYFLFDRNELNRESNLLVELIKKTNPSLNEYVERFNQHYTGSTFSILLQRTESFLMLQNVCKGLEREFPEVPFYTIHDSIITTKSNLNLVKSYIQYTIKKVTNKSVGLKSKTLDEVPKITDELIKKTFDKIDIKSNKDFDKKRPFILIDNVEIGRKLLN